MIIYFADRQMQVQGHATTDLLNGYVITDDLKTEEIETGVASFSCRIGFNKNNRLALEKMTNAGNYLLRSNDDENEFYTIIDSEIDTRNQEIYIYAEDAGLDLINEIAGDFEATESKNAEWYINKYIADSGFDIGINEIPSNILRKIKWEGESTVTERLASIATQFGGYEISFSFDIKGLEITNKYVNFYKERGKDNGVQLRLNKEIDRIVTSRTVANLATAFVCEGGVPDKEEKPITFSSKKYTWKDEEDDFFIDGDTLKSKKANEKWSRYIWNKEPNKLTNGEGYIVRQYSYDTTDPATLRAHAVTELKKVCDMEVNYEVDVKRLPKGVKIGDRINIIDDAGEMYISSRILLLETSIVDQKHTATIGEHLIKKSGIAQKVADLAAEFAKTAVSAERAMEVATNAHTAATDAQEQADEAAKNAEEANAAADEAQKFASAASASAATAEAKSLAAEAAANAASASAESIKKSVEDAQAAAENAEKAAETAESEAQKAATSAGNAEADAAEAKTAAGEAKTASESAVAKANTAIGTADESKALAQSASDTAAAAKLDAEQAERDVDAFRERLETYKSTMEAEYARKTDLTETTSSLQAQITANANQLAITHQEITVIDETANDAREKADAAQSAAATAQSQADQATAEAATAQARATEAATAAANAQSEADTAKAAAETAKSVADKAEADLEAAKADLATVSGRVDATEEEIAAAEKAVEEAQSAADTAKADAATATEKANAAQTTANTAVTNAANAQAAADEAASKANLAQKTADEAKGDASAAQAKADEAATAAANAQSTANTAVENAATAQAKANQAAADAATAQAKADEADARATQAKDDLETARQNLADTISRVDATEEEVAAAQAAVTAAQNAANAAQAEAEAAQATADTAKADAAQAQQDADAAKTAADNAQRAADEAKAAADKAQTDVNALVTRVSNAETEIVKSNEQIALRATKKEVESIQVGGRNLLLFTSSLPLDYTMAEGIGSWAAKGLTETADGLRMDADETIDSHSFQIKLSHLGAVENNEEVTLSFDYRGNLTKFGSFYFVRSNNTTASLNLGWTVEASETEWKHFSKTFSLENVNTDDAKCSAILLFYGHKTTTGNGTWVEIKRQTLKLEKGNKATDWTYAPEDFLDDITAAEEKANNAITSISAAEAQIQLLADSIEQLVRSGDSGTLLKQDSNGLYYFDISSIQDSLNDASTGLDNLQGVVRDANGQIDVLKSTAEALMECTEYVRSYTDENGQPCLELGEGDSSFKVRITNTEIQFEEDGAIPARINRKMLIIEKTTIKNELQFGDEEEIGRRSYIISGKGNLKQGFFANFSKVENGYGEHTLTSKSGHVAVVLTPGFVLTARDYEPGSKITWSYDIQITEWNVPEGASIGEWWMGQRYTQSTTNANANGKWRQVTGHNLPKGKTDGWVHVEQTLIIPSYADADVGDESKIQFYNPSTEVAASVTFRIKNVKLEKGETATAWATETAQESGVWIWKRRENGNLGLMWKEVNN